MEKCFRFCDVDPLSCRNTTFLLVIFVPQIIAIPRKNIFRSVFYIRIQVQNV